MSFHRAKLGHWIAPGKAHTGELRVAEIGIPAGAPGEPAAGVIAGGVLALAPPRMPNSTKFDSGQVLVVGGSRGLTGAVCMAAEAAIRAGAGYATVAVPADLEAIFEVKLTEVMSHGFGGAEGRLAASSAEAILEAAERAAAVVLGPGLGRDEDSLELARAVARRIEAPLLIDADGLNAHAERLDSIAERASPTVLTPHAGELGRLLGRESSEVAEHRLACAREAAERSSAIVVLKGDDSLIVDGGRLAISAGGSPGLATAGTGDVLSGTIGALLARGMEPFAATCAGVHAHQLAGKIAARRLGAAEPVIATDVIAALPAALNSARWSELAVQRAVAVVDQGAVERNCARLVSELGGSRLCAVVKANGYGHGAVECARAALAGGATWLAVAAASGGRRAARPASRGPDPDHGRVDRGGARPGARGGRGPGRVAAGLRRPGRRAWGGARR